MAQHAQLVAIFCLAMFGLVGLVAALFWHGRSFRIVPLALAAGMLMGILGLILVILQVRELNGFAEIQSWPITEGTVLDSRVIGERAFRPNIVYGYTVIDGKFRDSTDLDQPAFGGRSIKRQEAEAIVVSYPIGTKVTVHYNPAQPSVSVLRTSPDWAIFGKMGLGSFLFGAGLFLTVAYFRRRSAVIIVAR